MFKTKKVTAIGFLCLFLSTFTYAGETPIAGFTSLQSYLDYLMSNDYVAYLLYLATLLP